MYSFILENQLSKLFEVLSANGPKTRIKTLILNTTETFSSEEAEEAFPPDLSSIPPAVFARATANLTVAQFSEAELQTDQLNSLMKLISGDSLISLRELGLANNDVSKVDAICFA